MNLAIDQVRREASGMLDSERRTELGQYMTPSSVAIFMSSLFTLKRQVRLLDAGAGVGSLTSAFLDKALREGASVDVDTWEIEAMLSRYLENVLSHYEQLGRGKITAKIHATDFIEDASIAIRLGNGNRYTHAILNPPYKKINSNSKHRYLLRKVGIETVNLYTAFVALSVLLLEEYGELVAIIPRSFCNGTYYRPFRERILQKCGIRQIHLFESRIKAFHEDDVLQENVIIYLIKGEHPNRVIVSTSHDSSFNDYQQAEFDVDTIVKPDDEELFIHIPTTAEHTLTPKLCTHTLRDIGLSVSTGPVVDFRIKDYWSDKLSNDTAPLLYPHHFTKGYLTWPMAHKKPNALQITPVVEKMLFPSGHYVLVKRFSSKEERHRIVAYHLSPEVLDARHIGFENHLNVFHIEKHGIDEDIARGLVMFLNSTVLDVHFRVFSGHTQVNATDLRNIRYPSQEQLKKLGQSSYRHVNDQASIDRLIEEL